MSIIDKPALAKDAAAGARRPVSRRALRRRITTERIGYAAATVGLALGPQLNSGPDSLLAAVGVLAATGTWLYTKTRPRTDGDGNGSGLKLLASCQRALPVLTGAGLYTASVAHPGGSWWEPAAPLAWGALMGWSTPITRSAGLTAIAVPESDGTGGARRPGGYTEFLADLWDRAGLAPGTRLTSIRQFRSDRPDFEAIVVAQPGRPVPKLTPTALAAVFDLPEGTVTAAPIPGSGPGRVALTATPTLGGDSSGEGLQALWDAKVASPGGAAPGMLLVDHRIEEDRIVLRVEAEEGRLIALPHHKLARALGVSDVDLLMIETDGLGDAVVSVYRRHPLIDVREATIEDLTMDADGRIRLGPRHDGRPAHVPLYDPALGAITDLFVGAPGAGKSVALNTILAAERISGVVSIVADAQNGMSLPEANGRTYHFGAGIAAVAATLSAAYAVAQYRETVSAEHGWGGFEINQPWRLANITLDELNLILAADSDVHKDFKTWVTGMVGKFQSTGRKFGMGLRFAAQSIHLEDLGDKDKIRANAKNGTVWLGRTNSSLTQRMATDGVLPPGASPAPIPRYFRTGNGIDAAYRGEDVATGPVTAGMGNVVQGGGLFLMRVWRAVKKNKTFPGLIALYESAPIPVLTPEEDAVFRAEYAEALPYAEALLAGELDDDGEDGEGGGRKRGGNKQVGRRPAAPPTTPSSVPPTKPESLADRIVALLEDGPMAVKELRAQLSDVRGSSVSDTLSVLRGEGRVAPVARGVWQLAD